MAARKKTHLGPHKYERVNMGTKGHQIYKCQIEGCTHFLPTLGMAENRLSVCWGSEKTPKCDNVVTMTKDMLITGQEIKKPRCPECREERLRHRLDLIAVGKGE